MQEESSPSDSAPEPHNIGNLLNWSRYGKLTKNYWVFFGVALFFDAGFAIYFFLFNLFLLDAHFTERTIGLINGAFTLGSTLATLPAGALGRKFGAKPLLVICILTAPVLGVARVMLLNVPTQILLGFLAGAAMCLWGIAYLPAVARLTDDESRASAYSLIFCASIVTSAIGGAVTGYLPRLLSSFITVTSSLSMHRWILVIACATGLLAIWPAMHLQLKPEQQTHIRSPNLLAGFVPTPFLLRFLPCMALWTACIGAFMPFANIYLVHQRFVSMENIGLVFSAGQVLQLLLGLLTPIVVRGLGLHRGILTMQLVATSCLLGLAFSRSGSIAVAFYLLFSTVQWMCSPALYDMLMSRTLDPQRSHAASMVMFLNTLLSALAVTLAGASFTRFGYALPLAVIACISTAAGFCLFYFVNPFFRQEKL
jgi:MFS family permease